MVKHSGDDRSSALCQVLRVLTGKQLHGTVASTASESRDNLPITVNLWVVGEAALQLLGGPAGHHGVVAEQWQDARFGEEPLELPEGGGGDGLPLIN
jgi:hypothetical protein